jgi:arsenate reductase (glutaredoxin)
MLRIYTYRNCSTCQAAVRWLRANGSEFEERAIRETPPTRKELQTMLAAQGGNLKRLFNTSGLDYRAMKLGEKLPGLSEAEAFALLEQNGNLVKRPFLLGPGIGLVGFKLEGWAEAFGR